MAPVFILGSASPARLRVLRAAGLDPLVRVSGVDEDAVMAALPAGAGPHAAVTALAAAKARAVCARLSADESADCIVVGCDSMLLHDGKLLGKPHTAQAARTSWAALTGTTADLLTGHSVIRMRDGVINQVVSEHASTTVHFSDVRAAEISAYVDTGEPLQVAGGFTLDGIGGWFIDGVTGDPSSVIGISLPLLRRLLAAAGVSVTHLWVAPR